MRKRRTAFQSVRKKVRQWMVLSAALSLLSSPVVMAAQPEDIRIKTKSQRYPVLDTYSQEDPKDYITLFDSENRDYTVKPGDTLWEIARNVYGTGTAWTQVDAANPDVINTVILPGMNLKLPQTYYIQRQIESRGGFSSPACSYDMPNGWAFGNASWEACLDAVWSRNTEGKVYLHITDNRLFPDGVGDNWEEMQRRIVQSAKNTEGVSFSEPEFEKYIREDGRELIFYSFYCYAGTEQIQCAVAYVLGENNLAEFIGMCPLSVSGTQRTADVAIDEITRYMAASFQETQEERNFTSLKYRPYLGYENWSYDDLHNPFAMAAYLFMPEMDTAFQGVDRELVFVSKEWENLLRDVTGYHYDMTEDEWTEFSSRPLRASDLAWITEIVLVESPVSGRDNVSVNGLSPKNASCAQYGLTTLQDIAVLPNLESLTLEIGGVSDYDILRHCSSLKELSIASLAPVKEAGWLRTLPKLESLSLHISYFSYLNEMGYHKDGDSTFSTDSISAQESSTGKAAEKLEDVLKDCTALRYLSLENADLMEFGFLNDMPDLYTFRLDGRDEEEGMEQRASLFADNAYTQIQCLVVDGTWLRNPE